MIYPLYKNIFQWHLLIYLLLITINCFINIIIKSGVLFKLLCYLKFSVTFGCSNYGKYSLHIKHANISIFKLHEYVYVLRYIKKSWMSQFLKEEKWLHHYIKFSIKSKWKVTSWIDFYLTQLKTLFLCG